MAPPRPPGGLPSPPTSSAGRPPRRPSSLVPLKALAAEPGGHCAVPQCRAGRARHSRSARPASTGVHTAPRPPSAGCHSLSRAPLPLLPGGGGGAPRSRHCPGRRGRWSGNGRGKVSPVLALSLPLGARTDTHTHGDTSAFAGGRGALLKIIFFPHPARV